MDPTGDTPIRGLDDLLAPFHEAEMPRARWRVGTEAEKFGVFVADGRPIPFDGERSVTTVFQSLIDSHGWFPDREHDGGAVISLRRGEASITLEPGGQFELSGAPQETVHQTCAEFHGHMQELAAISEEIGIAWLGLGFHPFARQEDLGWVPKMRYGIMREYLPTRGAHALDMMRRTCTVQANYDYASEEDAMRKLKVCLRLSPLVTAMFANSPFVEGKATGERSHRARVWLAVDPDRSGLLPFAWADAATYDAYVEWALDVPMFLVKRGSTVHRNTGQTFRAYLKDGFEGIRATVGDWSTHLNALFPEARLKKTLEVRGADGQATRMTCALPALWKGILYEPVALERAESLAAHFDYADLERARTDIADHALRARFAGREAAEWASELLTIAEGGLDRLNQLNRHGRNETVHLSILRELVDQGESPADRILDQVEGQESFLDAVLQHGRV